MVSSDAVVISGGPREPATVATVDTDGSLGSAGPQLRLDQATAVLEVARAAASGEVGGRSWARSAAAGTHDAEIATTRSAHDLGDAAVTPRDRLW